MSLSSTPSGRVRTVLPAPSRRSFDLLAIRARRTCMLRESGPLLHRWFRRSGSVVLHATLRFAREAMQTLSRRQWAHRKRPTRRRETWLPIPRTRITPPRPTRVRSSKSLLCCSASPSASSASSRSCCGPTHAMRGRRIRDSRGGRAGGNRRPQHGSADQQLRGRRPVERTGAGRGAQGDRRHAAGHPGRRTWPRCT